MQSKQSYLSMEKSMEKTKISNIKMGDEYEKSETSFHKKTVMRSRCRYHRKTASLSQKLVNQQGFEPWTL